VCVYIYIYIKTHIHELIFFQGSNIKKSIENYFILNQPGKTFFLIFFF